MYLEPCPFCGHNVKAYPVDDKHIRKPLYQLVHTCAGGFNRICLQWATMEEIQAAWNPRATGVRVCDTCSMDFETCPSDNVSEGNCGIWEYYKC